MLARLTKPPGLLAAIACVYSWAFSLVWLYEIRGDDSIIPKLVVSAPLAMTAVVLLCALNNTGRPVIWAVAGSTLTVALLGVASIGLYVLPLVALMFWTAGTMPKES